MFENMLFLCETCVGLAAVLKPHSFWNPRFVARSNHKTFFSSFTCFCEIDPIRAFWPEAILVSFRFLLWFFFEWRNARFCCSLAWAIQQRSTTVHFNACAKRPKVSLWPTVPMPKYGKRDQNARLSSNAKLLITVRRRTSRFQHQQRIWTCPTISLPTWAD